MGSKGDLLDSLLTALPALPAVPEVPVLSYCALCPRRAVNALIVRPGTLISSPAWLQLCGRCNRSVRRLVTTDWPGDEAVLRRYHQLQAIGCIPPTVMVSAEATLQAEGLLPA